MKPDWMRPEWDIARCRHHVGLGSLWKVVGFWCNSNKVIPIWFSSPGICNIMYAMDVEIIIEMPAGLIPLLYDVPDI
jgi:hypothetical protein